MNANDNNTNRFESLEFPSITEEQTMTSQFSPADEKALDKILSLELDLDLDLEPVVEAPEPPVVLNLEASERALDLEEVPEQSQAKEEAEIQAHGRFLGLDDMELPEGIDSSLIQTDTTDSQMNSETETDSYKQGSSYKALVEAGGDFTAALVPLVMTDQPVINNPGKGIHSERANVISSPNLQFFNACARLDTGHVFGIVSRDIYGLVQHSTIAQQLHEVAPDLDYQVETMNHGQSCWWKADLPMANPENLDSEFIQESYQQAKKMVEAGYSNSNVSNVDDWVAENLSSSLLVKHSLGGKGSLEFALYNEMKVCSNGMTSSLECLKAKFKHTRKIGANLATLMNAFGAALAEAEATALLFSKWKNTPINQSTLEEFTNAIFKGDHTRTENKRKRLVEIYHEAQGALPGTIMGLMQSATYFATHENSVRTTGKTTRRFNLTTSESEIETLARRESLLWGTGAKVTESAMNFCLSL